MVVIAELDDFSARSDAEIETIAAHIRREVTKGSDIALRLVHIVGRSWLLKTSSGKIARGANREKYLRETT